MPAFLISSVAITRITAILAISMLWSSYTVSSPQLLEAAKQGDVKEVAALLNAGADINFTVPNKTPKYAYLVYTALEIASGRGHTEVVALLLQRGAKTRDDQWRGLYAATWAGKQGYTQVITLLLKHENPRPNELDPLFGPALISAVRGYQVDTVSMLLSAGLDPNWHTKGDAFPKPAILVASAPGHEAEFLILLDAGADPTPYPGILSYAAGSAKTKMVKRLLDLGMDPNDEGDFGHPLTIAACAAVAPTPQAKEDFTATVSVLIAAGAKVNEPARGRSALFCAREYRNEPLIALLEEHDAEEFETLGRKIKRAGIGALFTFGNH